ncbi:MAG TPA: class I SAM-dependent methyltransferase [Stellaceae bacterium]|nr:class I SAM-dependent methyltransferase [Stellaceae bacterium]
MCGGPFGEVRGIVGARGGAALSSCPMIADETSGETAAAADEPAPHDKARLVRAVFDSVAPRYDLMNDLMSGGIHRLWKREMIALLNPRPSQRLVDVAGGTGDVALGAWRHMARLGPVAGGGGVLVCDVNERMLAIGRARALDEGILAGIEWLCADAEALPLGAGSADLYTIAFGLRNVTRLDRALAEARRVLRPGGRFLALEFTPQASPLLQPLYDLYSYRLLPLMGQVVTGDRDAYLYLVDSIRRFPRQSELARMIGEAGLERVKFRNLTGGVAALHSAWRL